jgi:hypothetical protein
MMKEDVGRGLPHHSVHAAFAADPVRIRCVAAGALATEEQVRFRACAAMHLATQRLVRPTVKLFELLHAQPMIAHTTACRRQCAETIILCHRFTPRECLQRPQFQPGSRYDIFVVLSIPVQQICRLHERAETQEVQTSPLTSPNFNKFLRFLILTTLFCNFHNHPTPPTRSISWKTFRQPPSKR